MSHHIQDISGESHVTTLSEGLDRALRFTELGERSSLNDKDGSKSPEDGATKVLKRALSTKSVVSTSSSFAQRMQNASKRSAPGDSIPFRTIGLGSCGSVFEIPGTEFAYKKGSNESAIWNDYCLTNKVHNAVTDIKTSLQAVFPEAAIPRTPLCRQFHPIDDEEFWTQNLHRFPATHRNRQPTFRVGRILPLPQSVREALIEEYFDSEEGIQQEARDDQENKDCLVRVYMGERETAAELTNVYDSLRNFPLKLNMMEDLGMEIEDLASEMAIGLAILQWQAQVDGMDVEFVLGSSVTMDSEEPRGYDDDSASPHRTVDINFKRRTTHLWMFDFDKATKINLTSHDVTKKLVPAFLGNDPYYPRPQIDLDLWEDFCEVYLEASDVILQGKGADQQVRNLPQEFLDEVLRVSKEHEDWNEEDNVTFG